MPGPDPKRAPRRRDRLAIKTAALKLRSCAACGGLGANQHHVLPRGLGGDDAIENLVALCGSGSEGCHGAWHGAPYTVTVESIMGTRVERRDRHWVALRVGETVKRTRPDVIAYVIGRAGTSAGKAYLEDVYGIVL